MTLPTHILLGLVIGKVTGNYELGIFSSIAPDFDHIASYMKSGVLKNPILFWKTVTDREDSYGDQRGILHNILVFIVCSMILIYFFKFIGLVIMFGWLGHIILDMLDNSDYWPFYPNKKIDIRGLIKYFLFQEFLFFVCLLIVYSVM